MKKSLTVAALATVLATGSVMADSGAEIGTLTCKVKDVSNIVVYTTQTFGCEFKNVKGEMETYEGVIKKVGVDLSIKDDFTLIWTVLAPTDVAGTKHALAGKYYGVGADVAVAAGVAAKVLVGGNDDSFSLQPVSIGGVTGGGASVGIEQFELK